MPKQQEQQQQRRCRHPGYDNCKSVFMFYVVLFHMVNNWYLDECVKEWPTTTNASDGDNSPWLTQVSSSSNLFRSYTLWHEKLAVPGFAFLSGLFGKGFLKLDLEQNSERWKRTIATLLIGALNIQLLDQAMRFVVQGVLQNKWELPNASFQFWDHLETWYLIALLIWRFLTPLIGWMKRPLLTSMALALFHLHLEYEGAAEQRMRLFRFFPYYVAGVILPKSALDRIPRPALTGALGVATTLVACCLVEDKDRYLGLRYFGIGWDLELHAVILGQYVFCGAIVLSVILLVKSIPVSLFPYSHESSTLAIYVWHWFTYGPILWGTYPFSNSVSIFAHKFWPVMAMMQQTSPFVGILGIHVLSYIICIVIGSKAAWSVFRYVSAPNCDWLFVGAEKDNEEKWPSRKHTAPLLSRRGSSPEQTSRRADSTSVEYEFLKIV